MKIIHIYLKYVSNRKNDQKMFLTFCNTKTKKILKCPLCWFSTAEYALLAHMPVLKLKAADSLSAMNNAVLSIQYGPYCMVHTGYSPLIGSSEHDFSCKNYMDFTKDNIL